MGFDAGPMDRDAGRTDAGGPDDDAGPAPMDAGGRDAGGCAPGTVDVDGDPSNGCECAIASPPTEACNGVDDDCDPTTEDGSGEPDFGLPCDGTDADQCEDGVWQCDGTALVCSDSPSSTLELCANTDDEDCDGAIDEAGAIGTGTYYRDADGDGYGVSTDAMTSCAIPPGYVSLPTDCDDTTPARSPGNAETCNGRDDDCSGAIDDAMACPCPVFERAGVPYMFCSAGMSWAGAQSYCESFGYRLVKIEDAPENAWISSTAGGGRWWIGLRQDGDDWVWTDGTIATYLPWDSGEPNDGADIFVDEDCGEIAAGGGGQWNDYRCGRGRSFICEWP